MLPKTSPESALTFLNTWFAGLPDTTLISLFGLPTAASAAIELETLRDKIRTSGIDELVFSGLGGRGFENIYIGVSPLKKVPPRGRRGTKNNVAQILGVWLDLDTKDGSDPLADARLLHAYLPPTIVVGTGSGGVHMYWRTAPMDITLGEAMNKRLRLWAQATLQHPLDAVGNADRVLRLPGTLRFPKKGELDASPALVELLYASGPHTTTETITALTAPQWDEHSARITALRREMSRDSALALTLMGEGSANRWTSMMTIDRMEDIVNEISWERILVPAGWTQAGEPDNEGRVAWTRPHSEGEGLNPRSAIVDWQDSPNVMSLLSDSESTGLQRLVQAETPLTKLRVLAELYYEGSLAALAVVLRNGGDPVEC
jgi:hypothetical protein